MPPRPTARGAPSRLPGWRETRDLLLPGVDRSLPAGPVSLVESLARRFRPSWWVTLAAGAVSFSVAWVSHRLSPVVEAYLRAITEKFPRRLGGIAEISFTGVKILPPYRAGWVPEIATRRRSNARSTDEPLQSPAQGLQDTPPNEINAESQR